VTLAIYLRPHRPLAPAATRSSERALV